MSLFHWLFPSLFGIRLAKPDDDPEVRRLRECQKQGDVAAVESFLRSVNNPDEREFYVQELTTWPGRPKFFDQWVAAAPNCADAWLLRGSHGTKWAWEARTAGRAQDVDQSAEFTQIGNRPTEWPWQSFGDPVRVYVSVRDKALA